MPKSKADMPDSEQFLPSTLPPGRERVRLAGWVLAVLLAALLVTIPFARVPLPDTEILLPAYAAAVLMNELITSALLFALYSIQRSRAVLALALGYLFAALTVIPWVLTFPGVFAPTGLLGAGLQSTAAIAAVRRVGFPLFVLAYALLDDGGPAVRDARGSARAVVLGSGAAVAALVCALAWLAVARDATLPRLMADEMRVSDLWRYVPAGASVLCLAGLALLGLRRRSVLDLWLTVVLCAWLIETVLLGFVSSGRFSLGWWAGRIYGLTAASVILVVLLSETTTLYARLFRSIAAERRVREARLTAMEALSAAIAHEVNQPLASMVASADAGLRWLDRSDPDIGEARAALKRIVGDGHRAGKVVEGIRSAFRKGSRERVPLDINALIRDVLGQAGDEVRHGRVSVHAELDATLPPVTGNPVQLRQVVSNLVTNAVDAMGSVADRARVLHVTSERNGSGGILVSVRDSGTGPDLEHEDRIFEPFFTTKPHGLGMGLMICRSIVEAHGGRLWMAGNRPHGAVFLFTLPVDGTAATPGRPLRVSR